jgi:transcriptional regulator with XRE-family HTH domain
MSQNRSHAPLVPAAVEGDRILIAKVLARYANRRRQELGLTIEQAAELSGIEISEWWAMEEGCWAPEELNTVRSIANTLQVHWTDLDILALFVRMSQGR